MATSFDAIVTDRLRDPEFARHYAAESARIAAIDAVINSVPGPDIDGGVELTDEEFQAFLEAIK